MAIPSLNISLPFADFPAQHIEPEELEALIEMRGVACEYRKSVPCPCARIETLAPRVGCAHCGGLGYLYPQELRRDVTVLLTQRSPRKMSKESGEGTTGTAQALFPLGILPSEGDMLLPENEFHVVQQLLRRSQQQIDNREIRERSTVPDQAPPKMHPATDRLLYPDVTEIEDVYWISPQDVLCHASAADYDRDANVLTWRPGRGPEAGGGYSVRYRAPAAYMLNPGVPVYRAENGQTYPYRAQAHRLDKWGRPDLR